MKPKALDLTAALVIVLLAILFMIPTFAGKDGTSLTVNRDGEITSLPLTDAEYMIENNGITLAVTITDGDVKVSSADCPDGLCKHSPAISRAGETIVCLPAKVILRISGESERVIDGVAG